jgi:hypothetical protein
MRTLQRARFRRPRFEKFVADIAILSGKLRAAHLKAHIAQKEILTPQQISRYDALRGYQESGQQMPHHRSGD